MHPADPHPLSPNRSNASPKPMADTPEQRAIILASAAASFLVPYTTSSIAVALPAIGSEFSLDAVTLGWVMSAYVLVTLMFIVPMGRLSDLYGRKQIFLYGTILFTAASLLAALAPSETLLILGRVLQGIGGAMIFSTSVAIITDVCPVETRGRALGIVLATVYAGLSAGPFIGGILTSAFGWRAIFFVNIPIGLVVLDLINRRISGEWAHARGERFDLAGSIVYAGAIFGLMYGLTLIPDLAGTWWIVAGAVSLFAFIRWEKRTASPLIDLSVFRGNLTFGLSNLAAMFNYASTYAVAVLLSLYLQYIKGFPPDLAGLILVVQPVLQMVISPAAGRLSDTVEPRLIATAGMTMTTAGIILLIFLTPETPLTYLIASLILLGIGYGFFSSPNTNAIMSSVERRFTGIASGMVATMRASGQLLSMAIAMLTFSLFIGTAAITPDNYPALLLSVRVSFIIFAVLCGIGVLASYARGQVLGAQPEEYKSDA
ncbi:MAG: MFS transporter [Methanoregulaceae archaeon]|nr:MFS transporter [Methanoregulaceae archaeon]